MELRLGKMSSAEIAEWMGLKPRYYTNHRKEKLKYLQYFCSFEEYHGGVDIKEIYIPTYIKNINDDDRVYLEMVLQNQSHLSSISGMIRVLITDPNTPYGPKDESALRYRLTQAGKRTFGITADPESRGLYGSRKYVWAIKLDNNNNYRFKNQAEETIYKEVMEDYLKTKEYIQNAEEAGLMATAMAQGEISPEEYVNYGKKTAQIFYNKVIGPFKEKTGYQLVCATEHEVIISQIKKYYQSINQNIPKSIQCAFETD